MLGPAGAGFADLLRQLPTDNPQAVRAQLVFAPARAGTANLLRVPRRLEHTITVAEFADRGEPGALGLADLAVVAGPDRLALVSRRLGREVVPTVLNPPATEAQAPDAARLLAELARSGESPWPRWHWGPAEELPYLPRVRRGRTVLAPARWRPDDPALCQAETGAAQWQTRFARWRRRWRVPRLAQSVSGDHRITLDLDHPHHQELLRDEWGKRPDAVLVELPAGGTGWLAAAGRANEIAFPMVRSTPGRCAAPDLSPARPRPAHLPGSPWLDAELFCPTDRQNKLLTDQLPALLARLPAVVDRWFFSRQSDPEPHLRLRFHGDAAVLNSRLLPALSSWASGLLATGLAGRLVLDGYQPELERYGGPNALAAAERAFEADSQACLAQLALLRDGRLRLDATVLAAANYLDLADRFGDPRFFLRPGAAIGPAEPPAELWARAKPLLDPADRPRRLRALPGGPELVESWARRAAAVSHYRAQLDPAWSTPDAALGALLHTHHNRLLGNDAAREGRCLALARKAVRTHHDRRRALG